MRFDRYIKVNHKQMAPWESSGTHAEHMWRWQIARATQMSLEFGVQSLVFVVIAIGSFWTMDFVVFHRWCRLVGQGYEGSMVLQNKWYGCVKDCTGSTFPSLVWPSHDVIERSFYWECFSSIDWRGPKRYSKWSCCKKWNTHGLSVMSIDECSNE